MIHFSYVARVKRELIKCFDSQAQAGNSGRQHNSIRTQHKPNLRWSLNKKMKKHNEEHDSLQVKGIKHIKQAKSQRNK